MMALSHKTGFRYLPKYRQSLQIRHNHQIMAKALGPFPTSSISDGFIFTGELLFDNVLDTVFFLKDAEGRYTVVNDTLVRRCGFKNKSDLVGKTAAQIFPSPFGESFFGQDQRVLGGTTVNGQLELHLYANGTQGWCLTWKVPIMGKTGKIAGLAGISRDVPQLSGPVAEHNAIARAVAYVQDNISDALQVKEIAEASGLSVFQLDQRLRGLFGLSTGQFVVRSRIEHACARLRSSKDPISAIALDCGYGDQAAFARQFRKSVGVTPLSYRDYKS
jgi:AraC-like DNA-binding protein